MKSEGQKNIESHERSRLAELEVRYKKLYRRLMDISINLLS